jgi:hypothetical protein
MVRPLRVIVSLVLLSVPAWCFSQGTASDQKPVFRLLYAPRNETIEIMGGVTFPISHVPLKSFWLRGPSAETAFYFKANDHIRFGVGLEAALLSFRRGTFARTFPGVPVQARTLTSIYLYLGMRNYLKPSVRMTPFIGAEIGVVRCSGAEYKEIIGGVRHTYYDIPGMSHLAASCSAGLDYYFIRRMAVQVEGRAIYVMNDTDTGLLLAAHAGFKFTL